MADLAGLALLQLWPNVPDVCRPAVRPPVARPPQPHPALAWLSAASASARREPVPAFPLLPGPSPCLARPSAAPTSARCEPFLANSLLPGPSTHPAWPSAASASARYEPFPTKRLTPASRNSGTRPGTMAAGAREQAASCDAFVLSRRPPAPGAPPTGHHRPALSLKPPPTLTEPRPGDLWPGRDCRRNFRQARSWTPPPGSVLAGGGMTDWVWQGGSVVSTLRRGPCRASRHDRGRRKPPRDLLARAIAGASSVEHPSARGTSRCAPGAFSLTAMIFWGPRA